MFEGIIQKINRLETKIDELMLGVKGLSNDIEINLEALENRFNERMESMKAELRQIIEASASKR